VTLTPDIYVNKGPNRPAFSEPHRAHMLASLEVVDYVALNRWPSAVEMLKVVAPDVYAKGLEYRNHQADLTGKIADEEAVVRSVGGQIYYTEDITFSSSTLINRHLSSYSPAVNEYLADLRGTYTPSQIHAALDSLRKMRVLVVGEAIIDEYVYVDQMGKSSKEPVLAMRYSSEEQFAGGALAIANNVAALIENVDLVTFLGTHDSREDFVRRRLAPNVEPTFLYRNGSPTIVKRRYVETQLLSKLLEVYIFNDEYLDDREDERFASQLEMAADYDLVIVADFGHGILTNNAIETLQSKARFLAVNTQQNAANIGYHTISRYSRADFVCTNDRELRSDSRARLGEIEPLILALVERLRVENTLVTRGKLGALFYRMSADEWSGAPAFARSVTDRVGTGDAVLSWAAPMAAGGLDGKMIAFVANIVGAQAAQIVGNRTSVDRVATYKFIESLLK